MSRFGPSIRDYNRDHPPALPPPSPFYPPSRRRESHEYYHHPRFESFGCAEFCDWLTLIATVETTINRGETENRCQ